MSQREQTPEQRRVMALKRAEVAHLIAHEMRLRGYTPVNLGRELGVCAESVRRTMKGYNHSPRVLDALREIGVPEKILFDPRRTAPRGNGRAA